MREENALGGFGWGDGQSGRPFRLRGGDLAPFPDDHAEPH